MKKIINLLITFVMAFSFISINKSAPVSAQENGEVVELDFWTFWGSEPRRNVVGHLVE
ncbi:hypothetical protein ACTQ5R_06440 [Ruoffia tabacinasalis]|uniref:hypothetical protein n=1 Tax=Ruoffia tabacinasalis TaxID=87458 RepID=UPI003F977F64